MAIITTIKGDLDESLLEKKTGEVDNENESTSTIEYCLAGCSGSAHRTGIPDSPSHFCSQHVHRSVQVTLKEGAISQSVIGVFG